MGAALGCCAQAEQREATYAVKSHVAKADGNGGTGAGDADLTNVEADHPSWREPLPFEVCFLSTPGAPPRDPNTLIGASLEDDPDLATILRLCVSMFAASVSLVALFDVRRVYVSCSTGGAIPVSAGPNRWRWTRCAWTAAQIAAAAAADAGAAGVGGAGGKGMLVVSDTTQDPRFKQFAAGSPGVRFFCSVPLIGEDGRPLGTLGFVDVAPRPGFDSASAAAMSNFTALVVRHLEKRMALKAKEEDNELLKATYGQLQRTLDCFDHCVVLLDVSCEGWRVLHVNAAWAKMTGVERTVVVGQLLMDVFEGPDRTHLPSSALLHAAEEEAELQIPGARLRLQSPLGTPKGGFLLTFRPAGGGQADDTAEGAAQQQQLPGVLLGSTGAGEHVSSPFVVEQASGANAAAAASRAASPFYFMKVDLAGRAPTSRASGGLPTVGSGFGAGVSDVVEGLTLSNLLGKGSFGSVYFGTWMGTPVAVKIMDSDLRATLATRGPVGGAAGQAVAEAILGTQLRHPNIVATLKWAARRLERPNANVVIRSKYGEAGAESGGSLGPSRAHLGPAPADEAPVTGSGGTDSQEAAGPLSAGAGGAWAVMDFADHRLHELEDYVAEGEEGEEEEEAESEAEAQSGRGAHASTSRSGACLQPGRSLLTAGGSGGPAGLGAGPSLMPQNTVNDSAMLLTGGNNATGSSNVTGGNNVSGGNNVTANKAGGFGRTSRSSLSRGASGAGAGGPGGQPLSRQSGTPTSYGPSATAGAVAAESTAVLSPGGRAGSQGPLALGAGALVATPDRNRVTAVMLTSRMSVGSTRGGGGSSTNVARAFAATGIATPSGGGGRVSALGRAGPQQGSRRGSLDLDLTPGNGTVQTWIVMEYCDKGCLQDAIERGWLRTERSAVSGRPNMAAVLATAREVAAALAYLHSQNVVHGDLSGWNVMLCSAGAGGGAAATQGDRGFVAKVADFGLSRTLEIRSKMQTHSYGTLSHMPPELVLHGTMSRAVDVYSFGILLWQMYTGQRPWAGLTHSQIIMMIGNGMARLNFPAATPPAYEALVRECTAPDPDTRPVFTDIVKRLESQLAGEQSVDLSGTF